MKTTKFDVFIHMSETFSTQFLYVGAYLREAKAKKCLINAIETFSKCQTEGQIKASKSVFREVSQQILKELDWNFMPQWESFAESHEMQINMQRQWKNQDDKTPYWDRLKEKWVHEDDWFPIPFIDLDLHGNPTNPLKLKHQ